MTAPSTRMTTLVNRCNTGSSLIHSAFQVPSFSSKFGTVGARVSRFSPCFGTQFAQSVAKGSSQRFRVKNERNIFERCGQVLDCGLGSATLTTTTSPLRVTPTSFRGSFIGPSPPNLDGLGILQIAPKGRYSAAGRNGWASWVPK